MRLWNASAQIDGALINKGDISVGDSAGGQASAPGTLIIRGAYEDFGGLHAESGGALRLYCGAIDGTDQYEKRD